MSASSPLSPPSTARTSTCRGAAEMRPRCGRDAAEMHRAPAGSRPRRRSSHGAVGLPASAPPPPAALSAAARARQAQTRPAAAAPAPDPRAECPLCVWSCAVCVSLHAWPASSVLRPPIPRSPSLAVCLSPLALSPARLAAHARDRDGRRVGRRERHRHRLSCAACPEADDRRACCEDTGVRE